MSIFADHDPPSFLDETWLRQLSDSDELSETDSLFDEIPDNSACHPEIPSTTCSGTSMLCSTCVVGRRKPPPIPGFYLDPSVAIPPKRAEQLFLSCMDTYFRNGDVNQVMLFGRARERASSDIRKSQLGDIPFHPQVNSGLPAFLCALLSDLEALLRPSLPPHTHRLLFPPLSEPARARQAIVNLYRPGEGISPHVDLLRRFGDGIIGVSLGSGCVMSFRKELNEMQNSSHERTEQELEERGFIRDGNGVRWDLYLPERSILVLSDEARYEWTHGIEGRGSDMVVADDGKNGTQCIERDSRISVTFRWLLPGAEIVGDNP